jgi:branched-chain amino acid transport system substrate-binding protein
MSKKLFFLLAVVLLATMMVSVVGCGDAPAVDPGDDVIPDDEEIVVDEDAIVIGAIFPLTGAIATYGQSSKEAIDLAVEQVNAAGGVLGQEVQVIYMDNKSAGPESALAAERLIGAGVVGILGPVASSNSLAAGPLAQDAGIPLLSPTSTNPAVTEVGDYIFRACFIDPFQGYVAAQFAAEDLGAQTAAVLFDTGSDYSRGLYEVFEEIFTGYGGEIVYVGEFVETDQDFSAILTSVKAENPDVVYVPSYYETAGSILRQAAELEIDADFIGADGWDSPGLFDIAGDAANGGFFTNHYSPDASSPELDAFLESYAAAYGGKVPDALAALAFDAANLMFDAISRAGVAEPSAIRDALAATDGFVGVSGTITYDDLRNPVKSAVIIEIVDQAQQYRTTVNPN